MPDLSVLSKLLRVEIHASSKDSLQKMALGKLIFFLHKNLRYFSKRSANQQEQLRNDAFYAKTSQSAKN